MDPSGQSERGNCEAAAATNMETTSAHTGTDQNSPDAADRLSMQHSRLFTLDLPKAVASGQSDLGNCEPAAAANLETSSANTGTDQTPPDAADRILLERSRLYTLDVPQAVANGQSDLGNCEPAAATNLETSSANTGTGQAPHDVADRTSMEISRLFRLEIPQAVACSAAERTEPETEADASNLAMPKNVEEAGDKNTGDARTEMQDEETTLYPWSKHQYRDMSLPATPSMRESQKEADMGGFLLGVTSTHNVPHSETEEEQALLKQWLSRPCLSMQETGGSPEVQQRQPWKGFALPEDDDLDEMIARRGAGQGQASEGSSRDLDLNAEVSIADWWVQAIAPRGRAAETQSLPCKAPLQTLQEEESPTSPDGSTRLLPLIPFSDPCVELIKGIR